MVSGDDITKYDNLKMGSVGVCPVDAVTSTQNMGMNFCAGTIVAQLGTTIVYDVRQMLVVELG